MVESSPALLPRDLGDGLVMRRSTVADAAAIAEFNSWVQGNPAKQQPNEGEIQWALDLLRGDHPTFHEDDFTIVAETATGKIVSVTNLIDQTWSYGGIPFGVGRPESVGTLPEYRNRGLVRAQFEVLHRWSAERGQLVQGITGIPYYYRQFGYEMALDLSGGRIGYPQTIPALKAGETEAYRFRAVTEADLPFIRQVDGHAAQRLLVACIRDAALWHYEIFGKSEKDLTRLEWRIIETAGGEPVGYLGHGFKLDGDGVLQMPVCELAPGVTDFLLTGGLRPPSFPVNGGVTDPLRTDVGGMRVKPGASWLAVAPGLLRYLRATGESYAARDGRAFAGIYAALGPDHPLLGAVRGRLPKVARPYAWYLRVPDVPAFLRHIAPVLEARLAGSAAPGYTGELKLSFYRGGTRLTFDAGRLTCAESWRPRPGDDGSAAFPGLTFLQLLFGYRTLDELQAAFTDCWVEDDDARCLVEALFPKQPSSVWPVS